MLRIFIIIFCFPVLLFSQNCKVYGAINGKKEKSEITKKDLAEVKKLEALGDCGEYKVISYEFSAKVKGQPVSYIGIGSTLTLDMKVVAEKINSGAKVFFDNIKVKGPDGKVKHAENLVLIIKE